MRDDNGPDNVAGTADDEECDGTDFGGTTCQDAVSNSTGGPLSCKADCHLDTSLCYVCGNNQLDPGEQCEANDDSACPGQCIAAGQPNECKCSCSDPYADVVISSTPANASPSDVLGPPDSVAPNFDSVGSSPGYVVAAFTDNVVVNGPGPDLAVHLYDFFFGQEFEVFELLASEDGVTFVSLGTVAPTHSTPNIRESRSFDIGAVGLAAVRQVKVVNGVVRTDVDWEGPDVDAFEALNCGRP